MKIQETVKRETIRIAGGTLVLTGIMLLVFVMLQQMAWAVLFGALIGCFAAVLDFFLLGLTVQKATELQATIPPQPMSEEGEEPEISQEQKEVSAKIRKKVQLSHTGRMLMLIAFAALGLLPQINLAALVIPMLFPKIVIHALNLLPKKGKEE